jgi:hypothetical protein
MKKYCLRSDRPISRFREISFKCQEIADRWHFDWKYLPKTKEKQ